jgi:hypothetical protein
MFDERELVGQFRLSRSNLELPDGWRERKLASWFLGYHPDLPVMQILVDENPVGWLLGQPIAQNGALVTSDLRVDPAIDADGFRHLVDGFAGRFVAVWLGQGGQRVLLDASGSMGVVYCEEQRIVASTLFLVPYEDPDDDRFAFVRAPSSFGIDPSLYFGLTMRYSVDWLAPNHYLDLESWRPVRYWPSGEFETTNDINGVLDTVLARITGSIRAVVESRPVQMSLTGGNDTRVLLACSKEFLDEIEFVTVALPDRTGRTDVSLARHIAKTLGLRHRVIEGGASPMEIDRLIYRTGGVAALDGRCQEAVAMMAAMDSERPYLPASVAEVARMPSFVTFGPDPEPVTVHKMLEWRETPEWPELVERGARWLSDLPIDSAVGVFDMRAIEMRFGGWNGYLPYAYPEGYAYTMYPFGDRVIFGAMMSLPLEYRLANGFTPDAIARMWPELSRFPINESTGWYGAYRRLRRFARKALKG